MEWALVLGTDNVQALIVYQFHVIEILHELAPPPMPPMLMAAEVVAAAAEAAEVMVMLGLIPDMDVAMAIVIEPDPISISIFILRGVLMALVLRDKRDSHLW